MNTKLWMCRRRVGATVALLGAGLLGVSGCTAAGELVAYDLPGESAQYTLELTTAESTTEWTYHSARATEDDAPEIQPCIDTYLRQPGAEPCRPEPLIFLRYDLGLDLDNTVATDLPQEIAVTGYYQPRLSEPPQITELRVEVSHDGGQTWQEVTTEPTSVNSVTATILHPDGAEEVSLRVTGTDEEGNTVVQTLPEAYRLR